MSLKIQTPKAGTASLKNNVQYGMAVHYIREQIQKGSSIDDIVVDMICHRPKRGRYGRNPFKRFKAVYYNTFKCLPNPWFVANGIGDNVYEADDSATRDYFNSVFKGFLSGDIGGTVVSTAGGAAQKAAGLVPGVNLYSAVKSGSKAISARELAVRIAAIGDACGEDAEAREWARYIASTIRRKARAKGVQTAGAFSKTIPVFGTAVGVGVAAGGFVDGVVYRRRYAASLAKHAAAIHWRAYNEPEGRKGVATLIMWELLGFTKERTDWLMKEPTGWLALKHRMGLM